jgi:uncharacterized protein (TIGR03083 family)
VQLDRIYHAARTRMIDLAGELSPEQAATCVPACPEWTVADVYRHVTGVVADVLEGNLTGRGTPPWTGAQVAGRADLALADVCAEWAERGPTFEAAIAARGLDLMMAVLDLTVHENDVLGALGRRGNRADPALHTLSELVTTVLGMGDPLPVCTRCRVADLEFTLGEGEPELTLRTDPYELIRLAAGRRSTAQFAAADWTGPDPQRVFAAFSRFPLPAMDVVD